MTRFILLRHGQTDWNVERRYQGQADIQLNAVGVEQAHKAAEALRDEKIDVAYSSDLSRALDTAHAVLKYHADTELIVDPLLRERAFGELEGTFYQRDLLNPTVRKQIDQDPYGYRFENGGESLRDVYARAENVYRKISDESPDKTVLVVSHGTFLSLFMVIMKGLPISARKNFVVENAAPIFVGSNGETGPEIMAYPK